MRALTAGCLTLALLTPAASAAPDWVLLVRHAEKASAPAGDPLLSEAGEHRARQLAEMLGAAGVRHIVTSTAARTQATAAPLAARLGLRVQAVGGGAQHGQLLLDTVQALEGTVLVVGHSNTLAPLVAALGGPSMAPLCETSYGWLLALRPSAPQRVLRLRVGAADPPAAEGCQ